MARRREVRIDGMSAALRHGGIKFFWTSYTKYAARANVDESQGLDDER